MTHLKIAEAPHLGGIESQKQQSAEAMPIDERLQKRLDRLLYAGGRPGAQRLRNFLNGHLVG